jgi:hypothetical protein
MTMGLFKPKNPPDTISDKDWKSIQDRARKANPDLDSIAHPEALRRRKAAAEQHARRQAS